MLSEHKYKKCISYIVFRDKYYLCVELGVVE